MASVDGILSPGEWANAVHAEIVVAEDWKVTVLAQHDDKNLYLAFTGLRHGPAERYPEVLLDPAGEKSLLWRSGQWWLHASHNLCDSNGKPNDYSNCQPSRPGWNATRFPTMNGISEISISVEKMGMTIDKPFGIAFDVTDTHTEWSMWPVAARLKIPMSWQPARLVNGK